MQCGDMDQMMQVALHFITRIRRKYRLRRDHYGIQSIEDQAQEAICRFWGKYVAGEIGEDRARALLYKISRNLIVDELRNLKRPQVRAVDSDQLLRVPCRPDDGTPSLWELRNALYPQMSESERFTLNYLSAQEYWFAPVDDLAVVFGVSGSTIRQYIRRIRRKAASSEAVCHREAADHGPVYPRINDDAMTREIDEYPMRLMQHIVQQVSVPFKVSENKTVLLHTPRLLSLLCPRVGDLLARATDRESQRAALAATNFLAAYDLILTMPALNAACEDDDYRQRLLWYCAIRHGLAAHVSFGAIGDWKMLRETSEFGRRMNRCLSPGQSAEHGTHQA